MTIASFLSRSEVLLQNAGIATSRLDCLVLLEDELVKDRSWLLAHSEFEIPAAKYASLESKMERRAGHEPLAYIRGKSEFYGREFNVTPATLQPRPETETMIEQLLHLPASDTENIADIGTGSGCIAITAKLERNSANVHATEINRDALSVALKNAESYGVDINFYNGNLLKPLTDIKIDILLANLPYVPDSHTINQAAMQEPKVAIFGGEDGLELYRQMFDQVILRSHKPNYILTESLPFQHANLTKIAGKADYACLIEDDFIQLFKLN